MTTEYDSRLDQLDKLLSTLHELVKMRKWERQRACENKTRKAANAAGYHVRWRDSAWTHKIELRAKHGYDRHLFETFDQVDDFVKARAINRALTQQASVVHPLQWVSPAYYNND